MQMTQQTDDTVTKAARAYRAMVAQLLDDVAAGVRVLNEREGFNIPEALIQDRARNIVAGLLGNYRMEPR